MIGGPLIGWFGGDGSRKKKVMFIVSMLTVILTLIFVMAKINTPFIMGGICFFLGGDCRCTDFRLFNCYRI